VKQDGQATVEAAMTLPVVLIALLLIVQVGIVVRDAMALIQAAREGARAAAVTGDDAAAVDGVRRSAGPLDASRIEIAIEPPPGERVRGSAVTVRLSYADRLTIPIVSRFVTYVVPLRAAATMHIEQSAATPTPEPTPTPTAAPTPPAEMTPSPEPSPTPAPEEPSPAPSPTPPP
jgi:uncharacterized membrane protein